MKFHKIICSMLSLILSFSFLVITPAFAQTEDLPSTVSVKEENHICAECDHSTEFDFSNDLVSTTLSANEILSRLISQDVFTIDGIIKKNNRVIDLDEYYDFSTMSRFAIAEWAYKHELISEAQMIESYCDLLTTKNFENVICLNPIYNRINEFANTNTSSKTLSQKITLALNQSKPSISQSTNTRDALFVTDGQIYVDAYNEDIPYTELNRVLSMAQAIKTSYINLGLSFWNSSYNDYYIISLNTSPNGTTCKTDPIDGTISGTQCLSVTSLYVTLNAEGEISESDAIINQRLAHGMFHAIQNTYYSVGGWFKEACADWGAWATTGLTTGINFNAFINSRECMTQNIGNGAMLFPATIARYYGGAATIEEIYYQLYVNVRGIGESDFDFLETAVNGALVERGYSSVDFADIFSQMSGYLAVPSIYSFVASGLQNTFNAGEITYYEGADFTEDGIRNLDRAYFSFTPAEDLIDYEIEFEVGVLGNPNGDVTVQQFWYNDSGEAMIEPLPLNANDVVFFSHPHFDEGNPSGFVGIIITNTNADAEYGFYIDYVVTQN